jgi:hypothetical protein
LPSLPDSPGDSSGFLQQVQACADAAGETLSLLRKILSRADQTSLAVTDRQALVFYLLTGKVQATPPVAALRALADNLQPTDDAYWLCADPVHLHPDLDHLLLFSGESFAPTPAQAGQLVAELNQLFHEDGFEFIVGTPERWYLRCRQDPDVSFTAINKVFGQNILPFMPAGKDEVLWRRYLNEIQMQMTASEVNQQRAESGMAEINSVWCWGGGRLPECSPTVFSRVYTQQAFTRGLARHMHVAVEAVPDSSGQCLMHDAVQLIEFTELPERDDLQGMMQFLVSLQREYLSSLWSAIKSGKLDELVIYFAGQRFCLNRKVMRRWWRRTRQLNELAG